MQNNSQNKPQIKANYEEQNNFLRLLHEERMKKNIKNETMQNDNKDPIFQKPKIKVKQGITQQNLKFNKIYFNQLIYDQRIIKPNHMIGISSLFQDTVCKFSMTISQNIQQILITTYGFQMQILMPIIKSGKKIIIVTQSQKNKQQIIKQYEGFKNLTVLFKQKRSSFYAIFHPKLWLIKFRNFLRVVISTSNMHNGDWAFWQNAYWFQDFPIKSQLNQQQLQKKQFDYDLDFVKTLEKVLKHTIPNNFQSLSSIRISNYHFSNIDVILIPSIPGKYTGQQINQQGMGKVKYILSKIGPKKNQPTLTFNSTSLGSIDLDFCQTLYKSFVPSSKKIQVSKFKLIYPTQKFVRQEMCFSEPDTLFLLQKNFEKSNIINRILYKFVSNPNNCINGCVPHLKTVIIDDQQQQQCIFYMGSHNMTRAAWGSYEAKKTQNLSLSINNCELGILFLKFNRLQLQNILPYQYPPPKYSTNDLPYIKDKNF